MEPSIEDLEKIYSQYTTEELIHISTKSAHQLTPQAQAVLRSMLRVRNVDDSVFAGMDLLTRPLDQGKVMEQVELLRSLPCPHCGDQSAPINAVLAGRAIGYIVVSSYERKLVIGCAACLAKACDQATITSSLAGWWCFPWGPIRTVQAIVQNMRQKRKLRSTLPSDMFTAFVIGNTGKIEAYRSDAGQLRSMITGPF